MKENKIKIFFNSTKYFVVEFYSIFKEMLDAIFYVLEDTLKFILKFTKLILDFLVGMFDIFTPLGYKCSKTLQNVFSLFSYKNIFKFLIFSAMLTILILSIESRVTSFFIPSDQLKLLKDYGTTIDLVLSFIKENFEIGRSICITMVENSHKVSILEIENSNLKEVIQKVTAIMQNVSLEIDSLKTALDVTKEENTRLTITNAYLKDGNSKSIMPPSTGTGTAAVIISALGTTVQATIYLHKLIYGDRSSSIMTSKMDSILSMLISSQKADILQSAADREAGLEERNPRSGGVIRSIHDFMRES